MHKYKELKVWQKSLELVAEVYKSASQHCHIDEGDIWPVRVGRCIRSLLRRDDKTPIFAISIKSN